MKAKYIKPEIDLELVNYSMMMISIPTDDDETGNDDGDFGTKRRTVNFADDIFGNEEE